MSKEQRAYRAIRFYYSRDYDQCKRLVDNLKDYQPGFWRRFLIDFYAWEYDVRNEVE